MERRAALVVELVAGTFEGGCTALREQELAGAFYTSMLLADSTRIKEIIHRIFSLFVS